MALFVVTEWLRQRGDLFAEWHLRDEHPAMPGAVARRVVVAACGTSLGADDAALERHDGSVVGARFSACQAVALRTVRRGEPERPGP